MTYLELVNGVLRRLREDTVSSWNENTYSTLIGDLVNDAMLKVQNAHNWSTLITELDVNTVGSTQTVTLEGSGEHAQIWQIINDTNNHVMQGRDRGWMRSQTAIASSEGAPFFFASNSQETDGDLTLDLFPIPDAVYALKVLIKKSQARMTDDADVVLVPSDPVLQLATAYALEERGDSGGQNNMTQLARASEALSDAIALDLQRDPSLSIWVSV